MLELTFKIAITITLLVLIVTMISLGVWIWNQQIDYKESFKQLFTTNVKGIFGWIATRDKNSIYQNRQIVGRVSGTVQKTDDKIVFSEIYDTSNLDRKEPFEYRRDQLKIVKHGTTSVQAIVGSKVMQHVIRDVICEKAK